MTNEQQIKILRKAKTCLREGKAFGICGAINTATFICLSKVKKNPIPSFNYDNVKLLSQKYSFKPPHTTTFWWRAFWWRTPNVNVRLKCIDALINELKNVEKNIHENRNSLK